MAETKRKLAAIMFTDIEGYTALMQQNEEKAIDTRNKHRRIFNSTTVKHSGKVLQYYGDGTLSIFDSAIDAVNCGIEMQLGFRKEPSIPVRIGIHTGDIIFSEEEIIGDSVNVASRIESLAVPGSVFISDKVYDEIKNQKSIKTSLLKAFKLKNVDRSIEVYVISNEGLIIPRPEDIKIKTTSDEAYVHEKQKQFETTIRKKDSGAAILATKLYIPQPRSKNVHRSRLIDRLNKALRGRLTLISAPAGFGKTTLVSQWITGNNRPVAWYSLDDGDNDPARFLAYTVAAIQTIAATIGEGVLDLLKSPEPPPAESILTILLNDISTFEDNFVFILDDYHVIDNRTVTDLLAFFIDHLPPQMHLIITSREDPNLPLARLRVRDQLTELRITDLRFTPSEAAGFLNQVMDLNLSTEDIAILESRTEGWVAGLQLAALSMQGRQDISGFIRAFAGHDRYIVDYLVQEVLENQSEHIRSFLLQTAILDRLSGPLCDAVTGREDGRKILESLERGNLFIIPLDNKRLWYRYHHLFADVLHEYLSDEQPDLIPLLHQRASAWYEQNELPGEAIRHSLTAGEFDRAAGLLELEWPAMDRTYQISTWFGWAKKLPENLFHNRPVLNVDYAWALMDTGDLEAAEARLRDAERLLETGDNTNEDPDIKSSRMVVVDKEQFQSLPGMITTGYSYLALANGDIHGTVKHARRALDLLPQEDHHRYGTPTILLGLASWASGDLDLGYKSIENAMEIFKMAGIMLFTVAGNFLLGDIRMTQGRLREAANIYEQSLLFAKEQGESLLKGTVDLNLGMSMVLCEQGDLEGAVDYMHRSEELLDQTGFWRYRFCILQARIKEVQGDYDVALDLLDKAEKQYIRSPLPNLRPVQALKARVWIKQGRLREAQAWAKEQALSVEDDLSYMREFEHVTLARLLIALYKTERKDHFFQEASGLLERLLKAADEGGRGGSVIEILVQESLMFAAQGNIAAALKPLERALALAEPEGYVSIFIKEGMLMTQLLSEANGRGILPDYTGKLMTLCKDAQGSR